MSCGGAASSQPCQPDAAILNQLVRLACIISCLFLLNRSRLPHGLACSTKNAEAGGTIADHLPPIPPILACACTRARGGGASAAYEHTWRKRGW